MKIPTWLGGKRPSIKEKRFNIGGLSYGSYTGSSSALTSESMQLSAVYRCVDVIGDAVASLPLEPIKEDKDGSKQVDRKHITYDLLNLSPNKIQSRFTLIKVLIGDVLLNGNAFVVIERDGNGNAINLQYLPPSEVTIYITTDRKQVAYKHKLYKYEIPSENMIHLLNYSYDGIRGVSTLSHASLTTSTARSADKHAQGFFSGGANMSGILKVGGGLDDGQAEIIQNKWRETLNPETGNPNGIIVIEGDDMSFSPVSISPADAQMLQSRQFSVLEICRFFGVSPIKAFDITASSYNNIEQSNLSFLTDTLAPLLEKIENELNRKLFRPSERKIYSAQFDVESLLRADMATRAEYFSKMFNIGVFTSNDIRKKLNMKPIDGGDKAFVQGALLPIDYDFTSKNQTDNKLINKDEAV